MKRRKKKHDATSTEPVQKADPVNALQSTKPSKEVQATKAVKSVNPAKKPKRTNAKKQTSKKAVHFDEDGVGIANANQSEMEPNFDMMLVNDPSVHVSQHTLAKYEGVRKQQLQLIKGISKTLTPTERQGDASPRCSLELASMQPEHHLREIASFLTRTPHDTLSSPVAMARMQQRSNVTVLRRAWEEKFMHEASGSERPCVNWMSRTCFASQITQNGVRDQNFGLCEFYTEEQYAAIKAAGWVWPENCVPCILCLRAAIFSQFLSVRCNATGCVSNVNYANIANIVGEEGEYLPESCFVSSSDRYEGVIDPVVIPSIYDYQICTHNGVRYLKQKHPRPENCKSNFFF